MEYEFEIITHEQLDPNRQNDFTTEGRRTMAGKKKSGQSGNFVSIGMLWVKNSPTQGKKLNYLYGFINLPDGTKMRIHVLFNLNKRERNHPDYQIYRTKESIEKGHILPKEGELKTCRDSGSSADPT